MSVLKIGDLVRIKPLDDVLEIEGLQSREEAANPSIVDEMVESFGEVGEVVKLFDSDIVYVKSTVTSEPWVYKLNWVVKIDSDLREGDRVRVKTLEEILELEDEHSHHGIGDPGLNDLMLPTCGHLGVIERVYDDGWVKVKSDVSRDRIWTYKDNWVEKVEDTRITLKEFVEEVKKLGLELRIRPDIIYVDLDGTCVLDVSLTKMYYMQSGWAKYEELPLDIQKTLIDLGYRLSSTPLEYRGDVDRYYLRLPDNFETENGRYLNYHVSMGIWTFENKDEVIGCKTKFTVDEVDMVPIKGLIKEKVQ